MNVSERLAASAVVPVVVLDDAKDAVATAKALLAGGARAVLGYVNNVYTVYSRSMLWDTVNHLGM